MAPEPGDLERRRRSIAMLSPGSPSGLDREEAMRLLGELERLRRRGPALLDRLEHLTRQLRAIVSELKATLH